MNLAPARASGTAAAATSLAVYLKGGSGEAISTTASRAVFINSAIHTGKMVKMRMAHSGRCSLSYKPRRNTAAR
ncbi:MAG: hypothetical protein M5U34_03955 [Chloroflexi bacterium]|nr:hypothetical protein [Chloroflexota bacterium]